MRSPHVWLILHCATPTSGLTTLEALAILTFLEGIEGKKVFLDLL